MSANYHCFQARLDSFTKQKTRRASTRSKKVTSKATAWPHKEPSAVDLAFAGFYFKPNSSSPDNVQCAWCQRQLDGWEPTDNPAYEHLTHAPDCGFAKNICIRLRNGDPNRVEEDPMSEKMLTARWVTFADSWPLRLEDGFPTAITLSTAGWCYDPSAEHSDGVTCPYCSLSLDEWDAGDDPLEEHRRRAPDCLFFALKELYHPTAIPEDDKKVKGKRTSARASTATAKKGATKAKAATKAPAKTTRGKKAASPVFVDPNPPRLSNLPVLFDGSETPIPGRWARFEPGTEEWRIEREKMLREQNDPVYEERMDKERYEEFRKETRKHDPRPEYLWGLIHGSEMEAAMIEKVRKEEEQRIEKERIEKEQPRRTKRKSEQIEAPQAILQPPKAKRTKIITPDLTMASLNTDSVIHGTRFLTPERETVSWQPVDVEGLFGHKGTYLHDAGSGLSDMERGMTVEEWVRYNAKRGEEVLRAECQAMLAAFDRETSRALVAVDSLPVVEGY